MPVAMLMMLVQNVAPGSWRTQTRTHRSKVHQAGEGNDPGIHGVDQVAAIELKEKLVLDTWVGERGISGRTDQKTIGQPIVQEGHKLGDNTEHRRANKPLVPKRSGG